MQTLTVVAPTEHLKTQWAEPRAGSASDSTLASPTRREPLPRGSTASWSRMPRWRRTRCSTAPARRTASPRHPRRDPPRGRRPRWGDAIGEAFEPAAHRLALTGTPFRSDVNAIPFVRYETDGEGLPRSTSDHAYGYADALRDGVVRPVLFLAYSGEMRWRTRAGDEVAARLGEDLGTDATAQALRTALDPKGEWVRSVLAAADRRLTEVRRGMPDAGGLVIATDHEHARAYARQLTAICGEKVPTVLSDDPKASRLIEQFATSSARWLVAVRMVSEGVDIPRLAVGVYATTTTTPLFFAQAVGRFVRARRRGETASIFLPSVPSLLQHAATMEDERDHVLGRVVHDEDDLFAAERELMARAAPSRTRRTCPRPPSRRWSRPRTSTGWSSMAASSVTRPRQVPPKSTTTSGCPACWSPNRWRSCSRSTRAGSRGGGRGSSGDAAERQPAQRRHGIRLGFGVASARRPAPAWHGIRHALRCAPGRRRTVHWPRGARSSTASWRRTRLKTGTPHATDPPGPQKGVRSVRSSRRRRASRCSSGSDRIRRWFVGRR